MTIITLYTGGGASLSPQFAEGRTISDYVRLAADEGMGITDGKIVTTCIDALAVDVGKWSDCPAPPDTEEDEEATTEDYEAALSEVGV